MANGFLKPEEKEFTRQYKFQMWWIGHREMLKKIGYGVFIAFDAVLLLFALWAFIDGFLVSYDREQAAVARLVLSGQDDLRSYSAATAAEPLETEVVTVLALEGGRYDLASTVTNPNADWYAMFSYAFRVGGESVASGESFVLPGAEKPLLALAVTSEVPLSGVELELGDVRWRRVDRHQTGVYESWAAARLNLEITDVQYATDVKLDTQTIGRVTFTVNNKTAFSYYDPMFLILLKRGESVVGVSATTLNSLDSGETREVVVNWFGALPAASRVEVVPDINIFDLSVYKPLSGETTSDTRARVLGD
jgi:hypothetical protein